MKIINSRKFSLRSSTLPWATLVVRSFYRYRPEGQGDQRQLIAVLSELHASSASHHSRQAQSTTT
jgi:hypothetical protein